MKLLSTEDSKQSVDKNESTQKYANIAIATASYWSTHAGTLVIGSHTPSDKNPGVYTIYHLSMLYHTQTYNVSEDGC